MQTDGAYDGNSDKEVLTVIHKGSVLLPCARRPLFRGDRAGN